MLIDVAFLIIMILAVFKGFTKGLIVGIFSFIAFIIGLAAALKLSAIVAHHFEKSAGAFTKWLPVLSFALVFIIVVLLINIGARIIKKTLSIAMLGWLDRIGGIVLYVIIYTVVFSVILFFGEKMFLIKPSTVAASAVHDFVAPWGPKLIDNLGEIIPVFKDLFSQLQSFFETLGHKIAA
jgi:membrane protein required for colicin V production